MAEPARRLPLIVPRCAVRQMLFSDNPVTTRLGASMRRAGRSARVSAGRRRGARSGGAAAGGSSAALAVDEVAGAHSARNLMGAPEGKPEQRQPSGVAGGGPRDDGSTSRQPHRRGARTTLDGPALPREPTTASSLSAAWPRTVPTHSGPDTPPASPVDQVGQVGSGRVAVLRGTADETQSRPHDAPPDVVSEENRAHLAPHVAPHVVRGASDTSRRTSSCVRKSGTGAGYLEALEHPGAPIHDP